MYRVQINGTAAIGWMFTIYPLMSKRRQEKIREIISKWKNSNCHHINESTFSCGHLKTHDNIIYDRKYKRCNTCHKAQSKRYRDGLS